MLDVMPPGAAQPSEGRQLVRDLLLVGALLLVERLLDAPHPGVLAAKPAVHTAPLPAVSITRVEPSKDCTWPDERSMD